jgi:hypothetical protein
MIDDRKRGNCLFCACVQSCLHFHCSATVKQQQQQQHILSSCKQLLNNHQCLQSSSCCCCCCCCCCCASLLLQHEWPVKGHPNTPFVIASAALWRSIPGTSSPTAAQLREPVLLLAAMGDVGLTGKRNPGLVLHWSAVGAEGAASVLKRPDAAATEQVAVASLPDGWSTLPDMSWDAGESSNA